MSAASFYEETSRGKEPAFCALLISIRSIGLHGLSGDIKKQRSAALNIVQSQSPESKGHGLAKLRR